MTDPLTSAWLIGWFSCLMSAFPVAMLLLIPHTGWDRARREKELQAVIERLTSEKADLAERLKVHQSAIDGIIRHHYEMEKGT